MRITWLFFGFFFLINCSKKDEINVEEITPETESITINTLGGSKNDTFYSVIQTIQGGYIAAGYTQSNDGDIVSKATDSFDFLVSKFSSDNQLEWQKTFGGSQDDVASTIIQTSDGSFVVLGYSKSNDADVTTNAGSKDFWVLKLSNDGNLLWEKSFGFSGADYGTSLIETSNGGLLITGVLDVSASNGQGNAKTSNSKHAGGDIWVIQLNNSGDLEWSKFYGGSFTDAPFGIVKTSDNGFIIASSSDSNDVDISNNKGSYDFWVLKISAIGTLLWEKNFGGSEIDEARAITNTNDGNIIIIGDTRSSDKDVSLNYGAADLWLIKISEEGNLIWEKTIGASGFDVARAITKTQDNGFVIAGSSRSLDNGYINKGQNDALVLKIDENGKVLWQKTFGGSEIDFLYGVAELNNSSIVAVGESSSSDQDIPENKGFADALLIQIK